jgi:hypothetical protein
MVHTSTARRWLRQTALVMHGLFANSQVLHERNPCGTFIRTAAAFATGFQIQPPREIQLIVADCLRNSGGHQSQRTNIQAATAADTGGC